MNNKEKQERAKRLELLKINESIVVEFMMAYKQTNTNQNTEPMI